MSDRTLGLIFILLMLVISFAFQLQAKLLANEAALVLSRWSGEISALVRAILADGLLWRGVAVLVLAGFTFLFWLLALARLDLSFALIFASAGLAFSTIGGGIMLQEALSTGRIVGILVVTTGLIITVLS